ncbi:hypothetical protein B0H63DRAFT_300733 [Podospora didyma]|uniref:Uncharacterized protein n=1 Tax=Podospora didyma TaxID=330526 RepID=A0AAE0KAI9_9PEZI|nr:hypothetical protein B0H63DRAFT_300733 [Podospora didyma]
MATMEAATRHHGGQQYQQQQHRQQQQQQPYPSLPASPTLTNPDMILPDYPDYGRSNSPEPDLDGRDHSPLMMWKNAHATTTAVDDDLHSMFTVTSPATQQRADHRTYGPAGPITPTTPIIYGNGTMLSDIGEVTEVESTPGKPSPARLRTLARRLESPTRGSTSDAALRSSPTMGLAAINTKKSSKSLNSQRERRSSIESNSTITNEEQASLFADFDDAVSVGDSVFQGDDEESMASEYVDGTPAMDQARLAIPNTDTMDRLSIYSTTSISRKAEQILANAKRRLTTMEGNLTRARSSLHVTPPSYGSDASTPSPPFQRAATAQYARDGNHHTLPTHSPGHSRISSDIAMRNGLPYRVSVQTRSQSALGAAGGYRQPLPASKSADHIRGPMDEDYNHPTYKISPGRDGVLQPLTEDDGPQLGDPDRSSQGSRPDNFLSPTFGPLNSDGSSNGGSGKNLQRSASTNQMRDIKDQMKDLKGKISNLREQARVDSMKRRSLQSLRTPSPFTHSRIDQWYAEPLSNRSSAVVTAEEAPEHNPWDGEDMGLDSDSKVDLAEPQDIGLEDDDDFYTPMESQTQLRPAERRSVVIAPPEVEVADTEDDDISDVLTEDGDVDEELPVGFHDATDVDYASESGESLYHDTVQHPISHEDREDAFDYEHFFLHSAMGSMSQNLMGRRGSRDSFTSEDSTETTRGPVVTDINGDEIGSSSSTRSISRRNSTASVSTVETFATAEEGRSRKSGESSRGVNAVTEGIFGAFPGHQVESMPESSRSSRERAASMGAAKSSTLVGAAYVSISSSFTSSRENSDDSISSIPEEGGFSDAYNALSLHQTRRFSSAAPVRRPISISAAASRSASLHRPSVSSFDSTGTTRSFPLINKTKKSNSTGILTPNSSSPDQELKNISDTLMSETASICEQMEDDNNASANSTRSRGQTSGSSLSNSLSTMHPMQTLLREDKYLVEGLVAGLGRCVLGLTENGRASAESRMYRRRIDAARRILEGLDDKDFE